MSDWRAAKGMTLGKMVDLPPFWLLGALVLVWLLRPVLPGIVVPVIQGAGAGIVALGVCLMVWAVAAFRAHHTSVVPHQVPVRIITSGPFEISRNPIYLGDVLVLLGAVLWTGVWPALVLIPAFMWLLTRRFIAPEEQRMKDNFGAEFEQFCEKTRRWL